MTCVVQILCSRQMLCKTSTATRTRTTTPWPASRQDLLFSTYCTRPAEATGTACPRISIGRFLMRSWHRCFRSRSALHHRETSNTISMGRLPIRAAIRFKTTTMGFGTFSTAGTRPAALLSDSTASSLSRTATTSRCQLIKLHLTIVDSHPDSREHRQNLCRSSTNGCHLIHI